MHKTYAHNSLEEADDSLNSILHVISEGVWDWNANTGHVTRSSGWYIMLGYEVDSFNQDVFTWENVIHENDYAGVMMHFENYVKGITNKYEVEYRCKKADGTFLWIVDRGKIVSRNADGSVARMIGAHQSIHAQKVAEAELLAKNKLLVHGNISLEKEIQLKAEALAENNKLLERKLIEIEHISNIDPLTKVANRKKFEIELQKEVLRAERYQHPLSLVIFDLDLFKEVNDQHGHKVGDTVLCTISQVVSNNIRDVDLLARWGGDEFVLIFPNSITAQAKIVCEKIALKLNENPTLNQLNVTCSFGLAEYVSGDSVDALFQKVDEMLFRSKESGRNQIFTAT